MKNLKFNLFVIVVFMSFYFMSCHNTKKVATSNEAVSCIDKSKVDPNKACSKEYVPVCGCNGETYPNKCFAEKSGVTSWTSGECDKGKKRKN